VFIEQQQFLLNKLYSSLAFFLSIRFFGQAQNDIFGCLVKTVLSPYDFFENRRIHTVRLPSETPFLGPLIS
jgi:hypothetical protein